MSGGGRDRSGHQVGGLAGAVEIVGERWTLLIVRDALAGVSRFGDFHARLGISRKTLSVRLELLVEHGLMTKVPYQQRPVRCDYRLTRNGVALSPALQALTAWGEAFAKSDALPRRGARGDKQTAPPPPAARRPVL